MPAQLGQLMVGIAMETKGLERAMSQVQRNFQALDTQAQAMGAGWDNTRAQTRALESAMISLARRGLDADSEAMKRLAAAHKEIQSESEKTARAAKISAEQQKEAQRQIQREAAETARAVKQAAEKQEEWNRAVSSSQRVAVAVGAVIASATAATIAGIKQYADFEQSQISFETMLGDAEKAKEFLDVLWSTAKATPFEYQGIQNAARQLLVYGFTADEVLPILTAVGDVTASMGAGGNERIQRIILALGQMRQNGKLLGQEMRQLTEAGVDAWGYLAKGIGVADAAAAKAFMDNKDNVVPVELAISAIVTGMATDPRFAGQMERQSKTLAGQWSTFKDLTTGQKGALGEFGRMATEATDLSNALNNINTKLEGLLSLMEGKTLGEAWNALISPDAKGAMIVLAGAITGALVPAFIALASAIWTAVLPLLPFIAFGAAAGAIAVGLYHLVDPMFKGPMDESGFQDWLGYDPNKVISEQAKEHQRNAAQTVNQNGLSALSDQEKIAMATGKIPIPLIAQATNIPTGEAVSTEGVWSGLSDQSMLVNVKALTEGTMSEVDQLSAYAQMATNQMTAGMKKTTEEYMDYAYQHSAWPDYRVAVAKNIIDLAVSGVASTEHMIGNMAKLTNSYVTTQKAAIRGDIYGISQARDASKVYASAGKDIAGSLNYARDVGSDAAWNLGVSFANAAQMAKDGALYSFGDIISGLMMLKHQESIIPVTLDTEEALAALKDLEIAIGGITIRLSDNGGYGMTAIRKTLEDIKETQIAALNALAADMAIIEEQNFADSEVRWQNWNLMLLGLIATTAPSFLGHLEDMGDTTNAILVQMAKDFITNSTFAENALNGLADTFGKGREAANDWHFTVRSVSAGGLEALELLAQNGVTAMDSMKKELIAFLMELDKGNATWKDFGNVVLDIARQTIIAAEAQLMVAKTAAIVDAILKAGITGGASLLTIPKILVEAAAGMAALEAIKAALPEPKAKDEDDLPAAAAGGIVPSIPGGMPVLAGEGGEAEAIIPLSRLESYLGGSNRPNELVINISGNQISDQYDIERIGTDLVRELKRQGVRV